jgi:hypothetical protein
MTREGHRISQPKKVKVRFSRVYGTPKRVMWFHHRDAPSQHYVETLRRIGADKTVIAAATGKESTR